MLCRLLSEASTLLQLTWECPPGEGCSPCGSGRVYMKRCFLCRALLESPLYTHPHSALLTLLPRKPHPHLVSSLLCCVTGCRFHLWPRKLWEGPITGQLLLLPTLLLMRLYPFVHSHLSSCLGSRNPRNFAPGYSDSHANRSYLSPANWRQILGGRNQGKIQSH